MSAAVPKGYKQTKVGIIPEDWEVVRLGDIAKFYKGKGISKEELSSDGTPCIRYGELYTTYGEKIDNVISRTNVNSSELFLSKKNDIIMPASGETAIDIATASCVVQENIALGGDLNVIRTKNNGIFLSYYLNVVAKHRIASIAQGVSVVHLYASQLEHLFISIPPFKEQEKIAEILTTWDEAISKQEELIKAKEEQKKGLMQKLLSGEVRFGGFSVEWVECVLNKLINNIPREINKPESGYWRLGLRSHAKGTFHEYVEDPSKVEMDKLYVVKENDLILNITFAWEHAIAIADKNDEDKLVSHRFPTYTFTSELLPQFFKYYILQKKFKRMLQDISPGGAGRNRVMNKKDFLKLKVSIPTYQEQQKIAEVLSLSDHEINLLKNELDELKQQKKGLMQKLLTGEVRVKFERGEDK